MGSNNKNNPCFLLTIKKILSDTFLANQNHHSTSKTQHQNLANLNSSLEVIYFWHLPLSPLTHADALTFHLKIPHNKWHFSLKKKKKWAIRRLKQPDKTSQKLHSNFITTSQNFYKNEWDRRGHVFFSTHYHHYNYFSLIYQDTSISF